MPQYALTANDNNITALIADRFLSLSLDDETGFMSDSLEIVLADNIPGKRLAKPPTGAMLDLSLGYDQSLTDMGMFVVSGIGRAGGGGRVQTLTIRAHAAPYQGTPKGVLDFQTQKTRAWADGTTIGAMVQKMAQEHGMSASVSPSLASVPLPHIDQMDESDISFLVRLARQYDAIAKPAGGMLLFVARGESQSASGAALPVINLSVSDVATWEWDEDRQQAPGTVVTTYHDPHKATLHAVSIGSGDPVRRIKRKYKTQAEALAAAKAEMARRARGAVRLRLTLPGNPLITGEATLILDSTFDPDVAGTWLVTKARHGLDAEAGYVCEISAERPNSDPSVSAYTGGPVSDVALAASG
ncbi:contractile injection system protein, VgrG/Pvc8 family [Nguyenibacter vanlangensis]|uniref:Contractile injection system protein, VgrG/Pvc8 family n=1 Tax=Nguyenibacter vanlangensis TaxID=1216886 RepID=A0ABZ3D1T2_9PROT